MRSTSRKSRALLSQAGVSNLEFDIVVNVANSEWNAAAQIYQSSLANIGIKANIKPYETAAYLDQINNHRYTGAYVGSIAYASVEPVTVIGNSRHLDPSGNSNTGYTSEQYVRLYSTASTEFDTPKRKAIYARDQRPAARRVVRDADLLGAGAHVDPYQRARHRPQPARRVPLQRRLAGSDAD